ncbi:MAG: hypothetical protein M3252_06585, partial [Actinomycetota bacterium]|nr:hypothetical protein [Actinomycetota bacterium]
MMDRAYAAMRAATAAGLWAIGGAEPSPPGGRPALAGPHRDERRGGTATRPHGRALVRSRVLR